MHALVAAILLGWPGLIRSMPMPSLSHQTASLLKLKQGVGRSEGHAVITADVGR